MNPKRIVFIVIGSIIAISSLFGFWLTQAQAPDIAYGRLLIDFGVAIAIFSTIFTFQKEKILDVGPYIDAIRNLARGQYEKRIHAKSSDALIGIAQAFNELAGKLDDANNMKTTSAADQLVFNR